jgi:hypothetical protein
MHIVNRRSLLFPAVLLLVPPQLSRVAAQTNRGTNTAATAGNQNQAGPVGYIGRVGGGRALTIILVPTEGNQVTLYFGRVGDVALPDVKTAMLDKIGAFPLTRPLSDGIFFEGSNYKFNLRREADSHNPGSLMDGPVQLKDGRRVLDYLMNFFEFKEPAADRK